MLKKNTHIPVLLKEAVNSLNVRSNGIYLDGTFGRGGHTRSILSKLGKQGLLLAIDRDPDAIIAAQTIKDSRFHIIHGSFSNMVKYMEDRSLVGLIDGVLLDLGVSTPQIEDPKRGFSFMHDGPLDMRMDPSCGQSAAEWLANASIKDIALVLKTLGEERFSKHIATAIVEHSRKHPITRTLELSALITDISLFRDKYKHPATRSFQAIRIYINNEIKELTQALSGALEILSPGGRLSVISFHSLEDRVVKRFIRQHSMMLWPPLPAALPLTEEQLYKQYKKKLQLKSNGRLRPSESEIICNPRARSAVLRVAEKLYNDNS